MAKSKSSGFPKGRTTAAMRTVTSSPRKGKSNIGATNPIGPPQVIRRIAPDTVHVEIHPRAPQFHKR